MIPTFSHYSIIKFPVNTKGSLVFPGHKHYSGATFGYIRSEARARLTTKRGRKIPWRDYPNNILTSADEIVAISTTESYIVISARNVLNESGYRARINGNWYQRSGDAPLNPEWPVLTVSAAKLQMRTLVEAQQSDADILTGIPIVCQGQSIDRDVVIATCSDVAHSYEVHPEGLIGPTAGAWKDLSEAWENNQNTGLSYHEIAQRMQQIADRHNVKPSQNLLHSVVGQCDDGTLLFAAITGSLIDIAQQLRHTWNVLNAIVLDNGGSVGWLYYPGNNFAPVLLVAGPNRRPAGTVFLKLRIDQFLQPQAHSITHR